MVQYERTHCQQRQLFILLTSHNNCISQWYKFPTYTQLLIVQTSGYIRFKNIVPPNWFHLLFICITPFLFFEASPICLFRPGVRVLWMMRYLRQTCFITIQRSWTHHEFHGIHLFIEDEMRWQSDTQTEAIANFTFCRWKFSSSRHDSLY